MIQTIILILLLGCAENMDVCQSEHGESHHGGSKISTVIITGNDNMQFDRKKFSVISGTRVKLIFKNIGKNMKHNLVILKKGKKATNWGQTVFNKGGNLKNNFVPDSLKEDVIAHTKILEPGKSEIIIFDAPKIGIYEYVCTLPGHFDKMKGKMIVKDNNLTLAH